MKLFVKGKLARAELEDTVREIFGDSKREWETNGRGEFTSCVAVHLHNHLVVSLFHNASVKTIPIDMIHSIPTKCRSKVGVG